MTTFSGHEDGPASARPIPTDGAGETDVGTSLAQILAAIEETRRPHWKQITRAVLLSFATLASVWSGFQASGWSSIASGLAGQAAIASRQAAERRIEAVQHQAFDALMIIHYLEARSAGNEELAEFLRGRFTPALKPAFEAWLKTDPLRNTTAPVAPFAMAEYAPEELQAARRHEQESHRNSDAAATASQTASQYVLLTVVFASVLFFGSLSGSVRWQRLQDLIGAVAFLLFLATASQLVLLPIAPWK